MNGRACWRAAFALSTLLSIPLTAIAFPVDVVSTGNDPLSLTKCSIDSQTAMVTVGNRTQHDVLSIIFHFAYYDANKKEIGGLEAAFAPSPALFGGQSGQYTVNVGDIPLFGGTKDQIASEACEVQSAVFSGNHIWSAGQHWEEQLVAAAPPTADAQPPKTQVATAPTEAPPPVDQPPPLSESDTLGSADMDVLATWTTQGQDVTYLHVRVNLHPHKTVPTQASDFRLLLTSKSGGKEAAYGLNGPAPTFQRTNFLATLQNQGQGPPVKSTLAAVAPFEDLGGQGKITVFQGDPVTEVVTFPVRPDAAIDPKAIAAELEWLATPSQPNQSSSGSSGSYIGVQLVQGTQGVMIVQVVPQSPAQQAGLLPGDLLFSLAGQRISTTSQAVNIITSASPGTTLPIQIYRGGVLKSGTVVVTSR